MFIVLLFNFFKKVVENLVWIVSITIKKLAYHVRVYTAFIYYYFIIIFIIICIIIVCLFVCLFVCVFIAYCFFGKREVFLEVLLQIQQTQTTQTSTQTHTTQNKQNNKQLINSRHLEIKGKELIRRRRRKKKEKKKETVV